MKNRIYFKNSELDFFLQGFALNYITYGGATQGEVFRAASQIDEKSLESWTRTWRELAECVERVGDNCCSAGRRVSARDAYLRAFTYYRMSILSIWATRPAFALAMEKLRAVFRKAANLFDPPIEMVNIKFEGKGLPAYFIKPANDLKKRPTVSLLGGGDTYVEDLYFWGGAAGVARGFNILAVDLPGQGATPLDGMHYLPNTEAPMKAVVDALLEREDVDPEQLGLYGISLGGYLGLRAVAFEKRIRASAAATPLVDLKQWIMDAMPGPLRIAQALWSGAITTLGRFFSPYELIGFEKFFEWQMGCTSLKHAIDKFQYMTVPVEQINCPVLCMVSEGEGKTFHTQTERAYRELQSPKKLVRFTKAEGAGAHCQAGNLRLTHQVVFDWFDEIMGQ